MKKIMTYIKKSDTYQLVIPRFFKLENLFSLISTFYMTATLLFSMLIFADLIANFFSISRTDGASHLNHLVWSGAALVGVLSFTIFVCAGFVFNRYLLKRKVNKKQLSWMIAVYKDLCLIEPNPEMVKGDLLYYVRAAEDLNRRLREDATSRFYEELTKNLHK